MKSSVLVSLGMVCGAAFLAGHAGIGHGQAPAQKAYVTKRGDTILSMGEALRPPQATTNQMTLALVKANLKTFQSRTTLQLPSGTKLNVPVASIVMATDPETAQAEVSRIWRGDQHYRAALALEKSKDMFYAFDTYVYAAKLGHGRAQLRLGQLYDRDLSGFIQHDLQESAQWYEKARKNQVEFATQRGRVEATPSF